MSKTTYEEYLKTYGILTYKNTGTSMLPLLKQGRDAFVIKGIQNPDECKKWDAVLYKKDADTYILHRIIRVHEKGYDILGDNCIRIEKDIPKEAVLGVMTEYIRKGKTHSVNDFSYRLYVLLWCKPYRVRVFIKKVWTKIKNKLKRAKNEKQR